jgi:beta-glucosidase-like glycosyl hydrolase
MNSFNELNGIPATGNRYLQREILKELNFDGFVVSDWGSINEMIAHGYAKETVNKLQKLQLRQVLIWIWSLVLWDIWWN